MNEYRVLQSAVLISCSIHAFIIFGSRIFNIESPILTEKNIKVTYVKIEEDRVKAKSQEVRREVVRKPPPPFIDPENIRIKNEVVSPKQPVSLKPALISLKEEGVINKRVTLPAVELSKIDNPSYLNYYQIVREKIRRAAYRGYARNESGEVYISFSILSDGRLGNSVLVEEKSSGSVYLKDIALSSVKLASPFPRFPKDLDYPLLTFNVAISFESD